MTTYLPTTRAPRAPLIARKRAERRAARRRIAARTVTPLPADQRVAYPAPLRPLPAARVLRIGSSLLSSVLFHGAIVGAALAAASEPAPRHKPTAMIVEVREPPPPPPPPPPAPEIAKAEPTPEPPKPELPKPEPKAKPEAPEPPKEEPKEPPPPPPQRIVGLSFESTTEGGDGPAFAVGNTRQGETAQKAVDPSRVPAHGTAPPTATPPPVSRNQVASRVPTAGVKYVLPKRKRPSEPPYPEILKAQGIEADVTVLVKLGPDGAVLAVTIVKGSGYPELDQAARTAAQGEAFEPATRDGVAVPYTLSFTYRFRLESP
jgi:protein TonB